MRSQSPAMAVPSTPTLPGDMTPTLHVHVHCNVVTLLLSACWLHSAGAYYSKRLYTSTCSVHARTCSMYMCVCSIYKYVWL